MVRIRFPPAESRQTIGSSAAERDLRSARDEPALRRRRSRKREFGSDSRLLAPPCGGSSGLGGGLCVPFPTPGYGQQESRLPPIGSIRYFVRELGMIGAKEPNDAAPQRTSYPRRCP